MSAPTPVPGAAVDRNQPGQTLPALDVESMLRLLSDRALRHASAAEVSWLDENLPEYIQRFARGAAEVAEGIGCLVASDDDAGSFQDREQVSRLLFHVSTQFQQLAGLCAVQELASSEVQRRGGLPCAAPKGAA